MPTMLNVTTRLNTEQHLQTSLPFRQLAWHTTRLEPNMKCPHKRSHFLPFFAMKKELKKLFSGGVNRSTLLIPWEGNQVRYSIFFSNMITYLTGHLLEILWENTHSLLCTSPSNQLVITRWRIGASMKHSNVFHQLKKPSNEKRIMHLNPNKCQILRLIASIRTEHASSLPSI